MGQQAWAFTGTAAPRCSLFTYQASLGFLPWQLSCLLGGENKPDELGPGEASIKDRPDSRSRGQGEGSHSAEAADTGVRDGDQFLICSGLKMGQAQAMLFRGLQSVVVTSEPSRHIMRK